jgi:hypothetical protein
MVLFNHTSALTFDPNANDGLGHNFYGLLLQNPALTVPTGGATGTFLRKTSITDYATAWQTAKLDDLSDVSIVGTPSEGNVLTYLHGIWTTGAAAAAASLAGLSDVALGTLVASQVLTWNGTAWTNGAAVTALSGLSDVLLATPVLGEALIYNGTKWADSSVIDLPMSNIGSLSGAFTLDFQSFQFIRFSITANSTISGFTWPASGSGRIIRRIVEVVNAGSFTLTWPTASKWPAGVKPVQTLNGTDVYILFTTDGGTTVFGNVVGQSYS